MIIDTSTGVLMSSVSITEKKLQSYLYQHMERLFGVKPLCKEYPVLLPDKTYGRIDLLGARPNGTIVVFELKAGDGHTALNQALAYKMGLESSVNGISSLAQKVFPDGINASRIDVICVAKRFKARDIAIYEHLHCSLGISLFTYRALGGTLLEILPYEWPKGKSYIKQINGLVADEEIIFPEVIPQLKAFLIDVGQCLENNIDILLPHRDASPNILHCIPSTKGAGKFGARVKKDACVHGKAMVLVRINAVANKLNEIRNNIYDPPAILNEIEDEFLKSISNPESPANIVLAPRQYKSKHGHYTAFSYTELLRLSPGYRELRIHQKRNM